ncbi:TPA: hypothetical protein DDW69_02830 [candidate division CPR2 bacterium]|uniref:Type II secretion system protein n=1 Tax=candidate division CPR2 bacterium GW2011_GWC1_41_48 TaxID=1618344 RepID=A0A0G0YI12_UNCC2|nr:MAG: Type II secretion system F-like protein [candidate division CPR2 bacterium GW2011_GWC2_39_35]KKR29295.1 MAG: Type II secretion system protein [candidate division CPR2 bacterium GW2011_GWD2_39_7]KKR29655.1 MAG: Type II secretion system protein [candidate division CPR2 bacterium GW2011_GWD1_39_7]KKS09171.1 MAG: Type II secretion system protein [candidate division CPR2 bacterium GW2011_GWC1_41_48]OGB56942.1 MAG: hypothetical protein A2Y27_02375 [candidate division CPR2 bacterium GWD1_39_7]
MEFLYKARDKKGNLSEGALEARNVDEVVAILRDHGLITTGVDRKNETLTVENVKNRFTPISLKDKVVFVRELSIMISSGLPIVDALVTLAQKQQNKNFAQVIKIVAKDVEGGTPLASSLSQFPNLFSDVFVNLIAAGEEAGRLDEFLKKVAGQMEKDYAMKRKAKSAALYPAMILLALFGAWGVVVYYLVPRLKGMIMSAGGDLPFTTRILVGMSDFSIKYWFIFIPILVMPVVGFLYYIKNVRSGQNFWSNLVTKIPVIGQIMEKIYMARFSRTLSVLIGSGLPILKCVDLTAKSIGNVHYETELKRTQSKIKNGESLSEALKGSKRFTPDIIQMISVGEKTGALDEVTRKLAEYYEEEVETSLNNLSKLLEPMLIIVVGLGVGLVYYSIITPIYDAMDAMKGG